MTIATVALFGSHARGDAEAGSDVDILGITSERRTRHVEMGNVSLYLYPWAQLLKAARSGDLFLCHIVSEAKALHDPAHRLSQLSDAFSFKPSYADDIRQASDLAWYLVNCHEAVDAPTATKRMAWCVRTILIARSADQHIPRFAASALAEFSGLKEVRTLIARKDDAVVAQDSPALLRDVLMRFGTSNPVEGRTEDDFRRYFMKSRNRVALQTLRGRPIDIYVQAAAFGTRG